MPARPIVAAILLFWLAMAGWYVAREVAPRWGREDNPSFHIDLTDEVGAPAVDWQALVNGKRIGRATTQVRRLGDDLFEMKGDFAASEMRLLDVDLRTIRIQTRYQVNTEGRLLDTALSLRVNLSGLDLHLGVKGKVENGTWTPVFEIDGQPIPDLPFLQSVKLGSGGNVMNTMMPHRRIPGLRLGQKWRVPLLDPVGDLGVNARRVRAYMAALRRGGDDWKRSIIDRVRIDLDDSPDGAFVVRQVAIAQDPGGWVNALQKPPVAQPAAPAPAETP